MHQFDSLNTDDVDSWLAEPGSIDVFRKLLLFSAKKKENIKRIFKTQTFFFLQIKFRTDKRKQ